MAGESMRDIKRRITSVKNIQQITKAMEMVSAAKLRRAQAQATASRPFADKLREVLARLVESARAGGVKASLAHPLLEEREVERVLYVTVTADRGLAGGYNVNVLRQLGRALDDETYEAGVVAVGSKARDYLRKRRMTADSEHAFLDDVDYTLAREIATGFMQAFATGEYDAIFLVYTQFVNTVQHRPVLEKILPISAPEGVEDGEEFDGAGERGQVAEYVYEPSVESVLNILLPRYVETEVYRALMEAKASEHGARMTAMRNATDNAEEMIDSLTLTFNKARQASITTEISEIVGGAEALAGE